MKYNAENKSSQLTTVEMLAGVTNEELEEMKQRQLQPVDILESPEVDPIIYNPQYAIVMSNALIKGKMPMETRESKIFRLLVSQVQPDDTEFKVFQISLSVLAKILNISSRNSLKRDIRKIVANLLSQQVWVYSDGMYSQGTETAFSLFDVCQIEENNFVKFKLSDRLSPYLIQLTGNYTQYPIYVISNFTSANAIRVYEILQMAYARSFKKQTVFSITLDGLKSMLVSGNTGTVDKYDANNSGFKSRVIDTAVEQINANLLTEFTVSYKMEKEGSRSFKKVIFTLEPRNYSKERGNITPEVVEAARKALLLQTQIDNANKGTVEIKQVDPNAPMVIADAGYIQKAIDGEVDTELFETVTQQRLKSENVGKKGRKSKKKSVKAEEGVTVLDMALRDEEMPSEIANASFEEIVSQLNLFDMPIEDN